MRILLVFAFLVTSFSINGQNAENQTKPIAKSEKQNPLFKKSARDYLREGNKKYKEGNPAEAEILYRKSLEIDPNYDKANHNLGNSLYQQKKYKEAAAQYSINAKAGKTKTEIAESHFNSGNAHMELKQYNQAIESYKNGLRNDPKNDQIRHNLAIAKKELKKQEQKDQENKENNKKDQNKDDNKKDNKEDQNKDNKDSDKENKEKEKEDKKEDKNKSKDNKSDSEKNKNKPKQGQLSPSQIQQLLEAMNNEEKKTQKKINANRVKGKKQKQEKDW